MNEEQCKAVLKRMVDRFPEQKLTVAELCKFRDFLLRCGETPARIGLQRYAAAVAGNTKTPSLEAMASYIQKAPRVVPAGMDVGEYLRLCLNLPEGTPPAVTVLMEHRRIWGECGNRFGPRNLEAARRGVEMACRRELTAVARVDPQTAAAWAAAIEHGEAIWNSTLDAARAYRPADGLEKLPQWSEVVK